MIEMIETLLKIAKPYEHLPIYVGKYSNILVLILLLWQCQAKALSGRRNSQFSEFRRQVFKETFISVVPVQSFDK